MATGKQIKQRNTLLSLSILIPAFIISYFHPPSFLTCIVGIIGAFVWANWFEYFYHRWLDHTPGMFFEERHRPHHQHPENQGHINFGENWFWTLAAYLFNGLPIVLADVFWLHNGMSGPVLTTYVLYVIAVEELHWQAHTGGWIPFNLGRAHHMLHHKRPMTRFNVAFPLFDWLLGTLN